MGLFEKKYQIDNQNSTGHYDFSLKYYIKYSPNFRNPYN